MSVVADAEAGRVAATMEDVVIFVHFRIANMLRIRGESVEATLR